MSDPEFDLVAALDQRAKEGEAVAKMITPFYLMLESLGVPEEVAGNLTGTWLELLMGQAGGEE